MTPQDLQIIRERLQRCEIELQASRGCIKALEYGLNAVIPSHSAPAALAELWSNVLPEVADAHSGGSETSPLFNAAFQRALVSLSEHIADAVARQSDWG